MKSFSSKNLTRRNLFKAGTIVGAAALGGTVISGCAPTAGQGLSTTGDAGEYAKPASGDATLNFMKKPEPITDFVDTKDYEIVVVGAGAAGVACALSAAENGAKVAVLQKESTAISQGNFCGGILLDNSDPAGVEAVVSAYMLSNHHSTRREIVDIWAKNSGEAE